jgi:hypothetical protein
MNEPSCSQVLSIIGQQLRKAKDKDYLTELSESDCHISGTFNSNIKNFTIEMVLRHLRVKYGQYVFVCRSIEEPCKFEIREILN